MNLFDSSANDPYSAYPQARERWGGPLSVCRRIEGQDPRTNRHSWFAAWYERKCFRSRSEAEGGAFLHRGFATPRWRIFAMSLRDAADFAPDGVGPTPWRSLHFRSSSW